MDRVRDACSAALALREAHKLRTRLPLRSLTIAGAGSDRLRAYAALIEDESARSCCKSTRAPSARGWARPPRR
jgi:isoleucyl-tRNA synthetase